MVHIGDGEGLTGWLSPNGEFFPCRSGEHFMYAEKFYEEHKKNVTKHIVLGSYDTERSSMVHLDAEPTTAQFQWLQEHYEKLDSSQKEQVEEIFTKYNRSLSI